MNMHEQICSVFNTGTLMHSIMWRIDHEAFLPFYTIFTGALGANAEDLHVNEELNPN